MDNEYELSYLTVIYINCSRNQGINCNIIDMVAKSIGDDTNNKQLLILPFDN